MTSHTFKFLRVGGFDEVELRNGSDLEHLDELDPKLWVAIACPAKDLEIDEHTLALLDQDGDGRIRVPDALAATEWICSVLVDPGELLKRKSALPLTSIDREKPEGKKLHSSARQILANLGKKDAKSISPADTLDTAAIFAQTLFNGDGIVPPEAAGEDTATAQAMRDAMTCVGIDRDMSGLDGISRAEIERFFTEASAFIAWWSTGENDRDVMPLGTDTPAAFEAQRAIRTKVEDFFTRCALAAMDPRAAGALNPSEADLSAVASKELSASAEALSALPLARIEARRLLPLREGLNPTFASAMEAFRAHSVVPILGARDELSSQEWTAIEARLAAYRKWFETKPATTVDQLGIDRLRELVDGDAKERILALLTQDEALEPEAKAIAAVDKLVHFYRDLASFLQNFVTFSDFYGAQVRASFQSGTLYLDGRAFDLCLRVPDVERHATIAASSMACLAYCECSREGGKKKMSIVAAVTNGDSDFLVVGRNGVFYDRKGVDWDATIVKIVDSPISVRQAFWSPYKRLARLVRDQIERFASERAHESDRLLERTAAVVPGSTEAPPAAPAAPAPPAAEPSRFDIARFAGIFAAIGLALGALGTAAAAILSGFLDLRWWQMPLALLGLLLVVSGPAMLLAALKLRQRNIGPLLDANGWAINARARINIPFGESLTHLAQLPPGSTRSLVDPFAEKRRPWRSMLVIIALLAGGLYLARHEIRVALRPHLQHVPVVREWVGVPVQNGTPR